MGSFAGFICAFLLVLGPRTCRANSFIIGQATRMSNEIDEMYRIANADAEAYVTELNKLFENLELNAASDLAEINNATSNLTCTVTSITADKDIGDCEVLVSPLLQTINDIQIETSLCIDREVKQAGEEVDLMIPYVDSQLDTIENLQSMSHHCFARFEESSKESADANQFFACVWALHRSAELFMLRFEFIVDIFLAESLFGGYNTRVGTCSGIGTSALQSLANSTQEVYERIEICIADGSS